MIYEIIFSLLATLAGAATFSLLALYFRKRDRISVDIKANSVPTKPSVFVSYSTDDVPFVQILSTDLKNDGIKVWLDKEELKPGDNIKSKITEALEHSGFLLFVVPPATSNWMNYELSAALNRNSRGLWPKVIPIIIRENSGLPNQLQDIMAADFSTSYEAGYRALLKTLESTKAAGP